MRTHWGADNCHLIISRKAILKGSCVKMIFCVVADMNEYEKEVNCVRCKTCASHSWEYSNRGKVDKNNAWETEGRLPLHVIITRAPSFHLLYLHTTPIFYHGRRRAVSTLDIPPFVPRLRHTGLSSTSKGKATPKAQAQLP